MSATWSALCLANGLRPTWFDDGTGRGLAIGRAKAADDGMPVVSLHRSVLIAPRDVVASIRSSSNTTKLTSIQWLMVFLLRERAKGPASEHADYMAMIPVDFGTCPGSSAFGVPIEVIGMLLPELADEVRRQRTTMQDDIAAVRTVHDDGEDDAVLEWAWWAVNTRCITCAHGEPRLPGMADAGTVVLAPLLDLLNHTDSVLVQSRYDLASRTFELSTNQVAAVGDQVFISYGPYIDRHLLLHYGFVLPKNSLNTVDLGAQVRALTAPWPRSARIQSALDVADRANLWSDATLDASGEPSWCLWTLVQVLAWASLPPPAPSPSKNAPPIEQVDQLALGEIDELNDEITTLARKLLRIAREKVYSTLLIRQNQFSSMLKQSDRQKENTKLLLHVFNVDLSIVKVGR